MLTSSDLEVQIGKANLSPQAIALAKAKALNDERKKAIEAFAKIRQKMVPSIRAGFGQETS